MNIKPQTSMILKRCMNNMNIGYKLFITIISSLAFVLSAAASPNYSYSTKQSSYQGTYINEEIDVPTTKIGLPQEYTQSQVKEKGLEIEWNEWHARIRNKITKDISSTLTPQNYIIAAMCTIDKNQNISDIVVLYFPRTSLKIVSGVAYVKNEAPFYIYMHTPKKYYRTTINSNKLFTLGKLGKDEQEEISAILKIAKFQEVSYNRVPYYKFYRQVAFKIKQRQGQAVLRFPQSSKRSKVSVTGGVTDILSIQTVIQYTSDMFNDLERY